MATPATNIQSGSLQYPAGRNSSAAAFYIRQDLPSGTYTWTIPDETMVHDIDTAVHEVFNATSPSLSIGDSDSATGYLATADINLAAAVGTVANAAGAGEAYAKGRYYPTSKSLVFTWGRGTPAATPTGLFVILVRFTVTGLWNRLRNVG